MTHETSPGAALAQKRWSRPENVARRVDRLVAELANIAPALSAQQREELHAAVDRRAAA